MKKVFWFSFVFWMGFLGYVRHADAQGKQQARKVGFDPARPWVYWYWMDAAVSRAGIKADLIAMKKAGIEGAYLMPIGGALDPPLIKPPMVQLSPLWWQMVRYAMDEADSLGLKFAMDVCDGFATAGGPWITPALSMQKVVWSTLQMQGGRLCDTMLPQPESTDDYYKDIAVYAFPSLKGTGVSTLSDIPVVTTSGGTDASFLAKAGNHQNFVSHQPCWIQYGFDRPFTCRSVKIRVRGIAFQAYRLLMEVSADGMHFHSIGRLKPARSGWEDYAVPEATYSIPTVRARYFRFVFNPAGTEPGSEDLDAAKWKTTLKLCGITLFSRPQIGQFEGKSGEVWRISDRSTQEQLPDSLCVPLDKVLNITNEVDSTGRLHWRVPPGDWTILRMGHTSTGVQNATGGGGKGLECDEFNPVAVRRQFDHWFGKVFDKMGDSLAGKVLKIFHVDSWECGSQNWSPVFRAAFEKYCGYDPLPFLPAMAGVPVQSARVSESFLYDVRYTISMLIKDNFFGTLQQLAHQKHCLFSAESVAPTMVSDGMLHDSKVDIPMGEFWLRSPTHDKPNDILDAVSGGHIYGKNIIQAEAFTELHEGWDEYPGMLKTLLDRNYALGINRVVYHVFMENPWMDHKPGMTLNGVGLYFQRDQTWWRDCSAWVNYATRCQRLLQHGHPVVDLAVYTGWELPRRALLPDRLLPVLPGLFGAETVSREQKRLENKGEPLQEIPRGVTSSANIYNPAYWIDPLHGYQYDSFNEGVLLRLAKVKDGKVVLPGGASYSLLVISGKRRMEPESNLMKAAVGEKLLQLVRNGATILLVDRPELVPGYDHHKKGDEKVSRIGHALFDGAFKKIRTDSGVFFMKKLGKGRVIKGPLHTSSLAGIGLNKDLIAKDLKGAYARDIAWTHRRAGDSDVYFLSNQLDSARVVRVSVRVSGKVPVLYDAVTGRQREAGAWQMEAGRTLLPVKLPANGSVFIILARPTRQKSSHQGRNWDTPRVMQTLTGPWEVQFDTAYGGPHEKVVFDTLKDWSVNSGDSIRYYSGTAVYGKTFLWKKTAEGAGHVWLDLGNVHDIADIKVNGVDCGIAWTFPYRVDITKALRSGKNVLKVYVSNTWSNRLVGDHRLSKKDRMTRTNAPYRGKAMKLLPSGLLGPAKVLTDK